MGPLLRRTVISALVAMLICFVVGDAFGQSSSDQDLMSLGIEELSHVKVYGASRRLEEIRNSPSSVSVITADEIRHYGWRTLGEVLRSLRGFYTAHDRTYTYVGVRGFQRPGDYNARILLLMNGHRLNENVYGSALIGTEFPLDLDLIDHIEIVRGPGSSLFGSSAVFATINVITRSPASPYAIELSGDTSSFLGRSGRMTTSMTRGRFSGLVSGSMYVSAGHGSLFFPEYASPQNNGGYAKKIDGDRYAHFFSDVQYGNFRLQGLYSSRRKIDPTASFDTNFNDPGTRITDNEGSFDVEYRRSLSSRTDLVVRTYYDHYRYYGTYAYGGTNSPDRYLNYDTSVADGSGLEATIDRKLGTGHHLTFGSNYEYSFRVNQATWDQGQPPIFNDHRTPWLAAIFAEGEFTLAPKLILDGGARLDYFQAYGAALSPRAALIYSPDSRTTLKYIFGRAFRAPNAYESYYSDGMSQEPPLTKLQKENIQSHEVVFDRSLNSWVGITVDGYYNTLDHLIDFVPDSSNGLNRAVNIGQNHGRGLEFEVQARNASGWEARASYALADAVDKLNSKRLENSPLHQGKLNATIPLARRAFAGLELQYVSAQTSYQGTRVPPAFLTNLTFSTRPLWGRWELSASGYNMLDRRWFTPAGVNSSESAIQQDGRAFRFQISYRFAPGEKRSRP